MKKRKQLYYYFKPGSKCTIYIVHIVDCSGNKSTYKKRNHKKKKQ